MRVNSSLVQGINEYVYSIGHACKAANLTTTRATLKKGLLEYYSDSQLENKKNKRTTLVRCLVI